MRRRWSTASKLFAVLAVASGLGAFGFVRAYELRLERLRPAVGSLVPVVEAGRTLPRGTVLTEDMVRVANLPAAYAPPGAMGSIEQTLGRTLVSDLAPGEAVTRTRIGVGGGPVAAQVPSGLRAFTIPSTMPAGAVRPGDRVDVLATFGGNRPHTETVATGLEVLMVLDDAAASTFVGSDAPGRSLVLLVSPDAAERLAYGATFATFAISIEPAEP